MQQLATLLPLFLLFAPSDGYKILVYSSKIGHSHINFIGNIADTLVDAGHNVTTVLAEIDPNYSDGTAKSQQIIHVASPEAAKLKAPMNTGVVDFFNSYLFDPHYHLQVANLFGSMFNANCRSVLSTPGLVDRLKAERFDVLISENFDMCGTGLSHIIEPKSTILLSTSSIFGLQYEEFGLPTSVSFNPSNYMTSFDVHSIYDRAFNLFTTALIRRFFTIGREAAHRVFRERYGNDFPSFVEISSRAAYVLTNAEPLIDYAHPTLNKVVYIGGIGAKPAKKLDEYWTEVMGRRDKNVLLSFGSIAQSQHLRPDIKNAIIKTMSRFPDVTWIWKYENLEDDFVMKHKDNHRNVVFSKWMPQNDLLAHPNMTVFITHGGMGSVQETAIRGVPALLIPLFGDQPRNAASLQYNGLGKVYDKFQVHDDEKLTAALRELLEDESYKKRAIRTSKMIATKPFKARDLLIKHVEFAAEFGPSSSLRPQSQDMTTIEYYNLDIIFLALLVVVIPSCFIVKCVGKRVLRRLGLCGKAEEKVKKA